MTASPPAFTFVTPYWNGREMMRLHLASLRRFHPAAEILVSKKGGDAEEMEAHRAEFGVRYWLEDLDYVEAFLALLSRCRTDHVCVMDHDTVLLSSLDPLVEGVRGGRWDLVGIEERIRAAAEDPGRSAGDAPNGWLRFAPGNMDATLLIFDVRAFLARWGERGVRGKRTRGAWHHEYHYGICQRLERHKLLLPYHVPRYGAGNLIRDGETPILWHQWYGSFRERLQEVAPAGVDREALVERVRRTERAFMHDYPALDLSGATPAWGPDWDIESEMRAADRSYPALWRRLVARLLNAPTRGPAMLSALARRWERARRGG